MRLASKLDSSCFSLLSRITGMYHQTFFLLKYICNRVGFVVAFVCFFFFVFVFGIVFMQFKVTETPFKAAKPQVMECPMADSSLR